MDIALNSPTGDIDILNGLSLVTERDELQQRISIGITINLGEFFTHINHGLPWLRGGEVVDESIQFFLGEDDTVTMQYITSEIDDWLTTIEQVESVTSTYSYDPYTRSLTYTPQIVGIDGEIIDDFPPYTFDI